jgi:hypothetical protein
MTQSPITVVYLDHTAKWSGGEIALLRTLEAIDRERVHPIVALAADGPFAEHLRTAGIETHIIPLSEEMREVRKGSLGGGGMGSKIKAGTSCWSEYTPLQLLESGHLWCHGRENRKDSGSLACS